MTFVVRLVFIVRLSLRRKQLLLGERDTIHERLEGRFVITPAALVRALFVILRCWASMEQRTRLREEGVAKFLIKQEVGFVGAAD
jgi:hypothetical protein